MTDSDPHTDTDAQSDSDTDSTTEGLTVDISEEQLFKLLGSDIRMSILQVLWQEFHFEAYVTQSRDPLSFTDLRARSEYDGSGNFGYHLDQLTGILVERQDDGYLLSPLGYNLLRAIDTYATFEYETIGETVLEDSCPFCGGDLVGSYQREILEVLCRDCDGLAEEGHFTFVQLASTTATGLDMSRLLDIGTLTLEKRVDHARHGLCWECHSDLNRTLDVCETHERGEGGTCDDCTLRYATKLEVTCPNCGTGGTGPLLEYAILVPAVRDLFRRHDHGPHEVGPWRYRLAAFEAARETVHSHDPPVVTYQFERATESVTVRIEERDDIEITVE